MVIYLDSASNRKGQPNENFAREVMELFTLGEGHYGERDIKEAARAFTGWSIDPDRGEFVFRPRAHDDGVKTVLGRTGNFDGDAVLDILLAQPQTAEFIVDQAVARVRVARPRSRRRSSASRKCFRESGYDIRAALRALLTSDAFYAPDNRAALIKSPVELVVGTLRQFSFCDRRAAAVRARRRPARPEPVRAAQRARAGPAARHGSTRRRCSGRKAFLERLFRVEETRAMMAAGRAAWSRRRSRSASPAGGERLPARDAGRAVRRRQMAVAVR